MGMSTHIKGFVPPDEKWKQMKDIYFAYKNAKMEIPDNIRDFFNYQEPSENGMEVDITHREYMDSYRWGFEVDIDKLPKNIKVIRFYNAR